MLERPEYQLKIKLNGRLFSRVIIDQHYKLKHSESMNDQLILELVKSLDGEELTPESKKGDFEFFKVDPILRDSKPYRVILTICLFDDFVGVINAFRVE
jgi:hypothetical protein